MRWLAVLLLLAAGASAGEFDLQGFLDAALQRGETKITIPPGRYRVTPRDGIHVKLKGVHDVEIAAQGVELICTQTVQALRLDRCQRVTIRGLTIDYDPLPFTQGRITALGPDKSWIAFTIFEGYPEDTLEARVEIFHPQTRELRREFVETSKQIEALGEHRYRLTKPASYRFDPRADLEQVGDLLVTNNTSPPHATGHAVQLDDCAGVTLEDVTVFAAPIFGFYEFSCDGTTYRRCRIDRRPGGAEPRLRSLNADAFHSNCAERGPAILDCTAKYQGDDCVNIHGAYHMITACSGTTARVAVLGRMSLAAGETAELLPFNGERPPDIGVTNIAPDGPITEEEKAFIDKLEMDKPLQKRLTTEAKFFQVTFDRELALPIGSLICNSARVGNGFAVRGCDFGHNRSRGVLIKASHGEVSGNTIAQTQMEAILVTPETWWLEAASASDLDIRDNTIIGARKVAIEIKARGGDGKSLAAGAHRDIRVIGNTVKESVWPNIRIASTRGAVVKGNKLDATEAVLDPPPAQPRNWGASKPKPILVEVSEEVTVEP